MPVDSLSSGFIPKQTTLFRPVTQSSLRSNMSDFFNRTQQFVGDQLEGIAHSHIKDANERRSRRDEEDSANRLQPQGMGRFVDLFI